MQDLREEAARRLLMVPGETYAFPVGILNSFAVPLAGGQSAGPLLKHVSPDGTFCL